MTKRAFSFPFFKTILFYFLCIVLIPCRAVDLIVAGKPCAEIVIDGKADPGVRAAANDLQKYLRLMSGSELKIVTPDKIKAKVKICVGESGCSRKAGYKMPVFHHSGYDIWVKGNCIVLNGPASFHAKEPHPFEKALHPQSRPLTLSSVQSLNKQLQISLADDCGPMHAVSAFLELLGVRFYAPYEEGTIIPHKKTISIPECRITREAAFARREYQACSSNLDTEGMLWLKRLKTGSSAPRIGTLPLGLVMRREGTKHPEWSGRNRQKQLLQTQEQCGVPSYLSQSFREVCVQYLRKMFDDDRNLKYIVMAEPASRSIFGYWEYESFRNRGHNPDPVRNNIRFDFALAVAKELKKTHPDRKIVWVNLKNEVMPDYRYLPCRQENLLLFPGSLSVHHYAEEGYRKFMESRYKAATGTPPVKAEQHEFWEMAAELQNTPQGFWAFRALQQARRMQTTYLSGFLTDLATDQTGHLAAVPLTHLGIYVNSKLLWNPNLDLKALLDEYYTLWYGPAAAEMREFQAFAEHVAARGGKRSIALKGGKLKETDIPVWFHLLAKAKSAVTPGSVYRKRIEALEHSFDWMKTAFQNKTPKGKMIQASLLPWDAACDGNLAKYQKWIPLPSSKSGQKTEISVAMSEARNLLHMGFRCYEKEMKKLPQKALLPDSYEIFQRDRMEFSFYTPTHGIYTIAVDPSGTLFDGSSESRDLDISGVFDGWNPPLTRCCVRRYADRWEGEVFIDLATCGATPDWSPAWGLNAARIRYENGKRECVTLVPGAEVFPSSNLALWHQLTMPQTDVKGNFCSVYKNIVIPLSGVRSEPCYTIRKAAGKVELSEAWNGKSWKHIPELCLGYELHKFGVSSSFHPEPRVKMQYDDQYLYILCQVKDRYVCANAKQDQGPTSQDSTMEFFIRPNGKGCYYNFEVNCIGKLLLGKCTPQGLGYRMELLSLKELQTIKRFFTIPPNIKGEIKTPITWYLGLQIPLELFVRHAGVKLPLSHQVWSANVFKCADRCSHPCWLLWHPAPTYHSPENFGTIIFE